MHTSFCFEEKGYSHISKGFNSWWDCKSGHRHTRQYITWGKPLRCDTLKKYKQETHQIHSTFPRVFHTLNLKLGTISVRFTCNLPSKLLGIVTHLLGCPGQLSAFSNSSIAPFFFFNFLTNESTAFSAHFSSSSPCFQPSSFFTAGLVNENRLFSADISQYLHKVLNI